MRYSWVIDQALHCSGKSHQNWDCCVISHSQSKAFLLWKLPTHCVYVWETFGKSFCLAGEVLQYNRWLSSYFYFLIHWLLDRAGQDFWDSCLMYSILSYYHVVFGRSSFPFIPLRLMISMASVHRPPSCLVSYKVWGLSIQACILVFPQS